VKGPAHQRYSSYEENTGSEKKIEGVPEVEPGNPYRAGMMTDYRRAVWHERRNEGVLAEGGKAAATPARDG